MDHQEPWRQDRRRENLRAWEIGTAAGERTIEIIAALAVHAVALDDSLSAEEIDALPLKVVADTVTGKRDYELLAGLPDPFTDERDGHAVSVFRLCVYRGGQYSLQLVRLGRELHHALIVLAERAPIRSPTCGDVFRRASAELS
ncbi:hypothetical protein [Streptomyces graminilatus]|uniref:hypothetical protein n=1 Tax=Streptomyces graminilatus TaxID=1464070 RepID=UPI0012FEA6D8|nr:hypothetical protein [Streptomyces graminilatus]